MPRPYDISVLLNSIKSSEIEDLYREITYKAVEWATAGFITEANLLLNCLWSQGLEHPTSLRMQDEALQVMWESAGVYPPNIPFALNDTKEIEIQNRNALFASFAHYLEQIPTIPHRELTTEEWLTVLTEIDTRIEAAVGYQHGFLTTCAAILSLRLQLIPLAKKYIIEWGKGYRRNDTTYACDLVRNSGIATILLQGILATVFELDEKKCLHELDMISTSLKERLINGRSLAYGDLSWELILKRISVLAIEEYPKAYSQQKVQSKWLGNMPADEAEIVAVEKRIGMALPADYRAFLKVSNGFDRPSIADGQIIPVEKVDWLSVLDDSTQDYVTQILNWEENKLRYKDITKDCLLISAVNEEQQVLLFPKKDNTWECWSLVIAGGVGEQSFPSFRYYMEYQLQILEELY